MTQQQRGFTLLEILLVLSLLGVLLALVGGAILGANRAVAKAGHYTERLDEVRAAQDFLRRAIGQALPLDDGQQRVFIGSAQTMAFMAPLSANLGGGIVLHSLALHGRHLDVALSQNGQPWGEPQVLLHQVRRLQFSYRGYSPKGELTAWLDNWPWPGRLPRTVQIAAQLGGPVPWTTESVTLRLDLSTVAGQ
ncbi:general secretion pathway protein J [Pseudomonas sp. M47T1]|uniref:prepilin-type N-terminal cleavage/methylation domain-containing protein n=1 Tax=unclassified Pseudomonas TaxID=196821 RepID=UPI000260897C|nr:prepilin-type N-terminal cleavage/methylation domain-containing protein [Pseudomonas sp. M47T1]EIK96278.1 general secretion pathway protein J [Pseudomonas sp. M47T1]